MPDPTDKLLVEAVLSRPRRSKRELEEAGLATARPGKKATAAAGAADDEDLDDEDLDDEDLDDAVTSDYD